MKLHHEISFEMGLDEFEEPMPTCKCKVSEDTRTTTNWKYVSCKNCLKVKGKVIKGMNEQNKQIAKSLGKQAQYSTKVES